MRSSFLVSSCSHSINRDSISLIFFCAKICAVEGLVFIITFGRVVSSAGWLASRHFFSRSVELRIFLFSRISVASRLRRLSASFVSFPSLCSRYTSFAASCVSNFCALLILALYFSRSVMISVLFDSTLFALCSMEPTASIRNGDFATPICVKFGTRGTTSTSFPTDSSLWGIGQPISGKKESSTCVFAIRSILTSCNSKGAGFSCPPIVSM
mmetsp:Transcript_19183/g.28576  ORF Transcript_19183/g.28576 Transcript_19183/m.28576 type:complete len:212 (+) Transcript_19183:124-759(+)